MRWVGLPFVAAIGFAGPAAAQEATAAFAAERDAAHAALVRAEKLFNDGQRGADTEACALMGDYFRHMVKAAAAAGAKTRIADWPELDWQERNAVMEKMPGAFVRNEKLRSVACGARS